MRKVEWRRLHHQKLHSLYRSFTRNIVTMIKCKRLRWADHVAKMEEGRSAFKILTVKTAGKKLEEDVGVVGRAILQ